MPTIAELSAVYANFMLSPRPGPDVCRTCFNFTRGYEQCYGCMAAEPRLDLVVPISYSVSYEQLHHALWSYKRQAGAAAMHSGAAVAAILWRFLALHERCVVNALEISRFPLLTTVPSGSRERDRQHALRRLVGEAVAVTRERYERLLARTEHEVPPHTFSAAKYAPLRALQGEPVLLIDDTWTTGASAQSAAAALKAAGAGAVAAVVIGRHLNRSWHENDSRLARLSRPFDWQRCVLCAPSEEQAATYSLAASRAPPRTCL